MTLATSHRVFEPGTTGWTVEDWYDLDSQRLLPEGRFELVDGVLTMMAAQGLEGVDPLSELRDLLKSHLIATNQKGIFHHEVDLLLRRDRIARPDMIYLTAEQRGRQQQLQRERQRPRGRYHPVYVMPDLLVESVSVGTERHDRVTKRRWYAAAGIPHHWILTAHERSLVCLLLQGKRYVEEATGIDNEMIHSSIFGGVSIRLADIWVEE
jgi:Uma2 family endonuclease